MREVTLKELTDLAYAAKSQLWADAGEYNRDVKLYIHWTAARYDQFFDDYHISIDGDGKIYVSTDNLAEIKAHTYHRNSGAIGIALNSAYQATCSDHNLGDYPPTDAQIEAVAQVIAVLANALDLTIDLKRVMTHAEAADNMDGEYYHEPYGPTTTCERWDLWFLHPQDEDGTGGDILRGKGIFYSHEMYGNY